MQSKSVIIMRGISGSGKSYLARQLCLSSQDSVIISADDFFMTDDGEYRWDHDKLPEAHAQCFRRFLKALDQGIALVIVDNTNLSAIEIAPYMIAARSFEYEAAVMEVVCDQKVAAERNAHNVPSEMVSVQAYRLSTNHLPPRWPVVKVDSNPSKED